MRMETQTHILYRRIFRSIVNNSTEFGSLPTEINREKRMLGYA